MCRKCSNCKIIDADQECSIPLKYSLVILLLIFITFSSIAISCYTAHRIKILSNDLNDLRLVLSRVKIRPPNDGLYKFPERQELNNNIVQPINTFAVEQRVDESVVKRVRRNVELNNEKIDKETQLPPTENSDDFTTSKQEIHSEKKTDTEEDLHSIKKKAIAFDDNSEVESFTPVYQIPTIRYRHRQRGKNQLEIIDEFSPQAGRLKSLIAAHYSGDTSKYVYGQHSNFNGNGHLRHPKKTFVDWKESEWMETLGTGSSFFLNGGLVIVKESGLYFVYAQVFYLDEHDMNGYRVYKNNDIFLQCTTTSHSNERMMKGNTCYTAGVTYLDTNESISISDISDGRYSLFEPGKSFFGLIKLGDAKRR